jgi:hypothetical protein
MFRSWASSASAMLNTSFPCLISRFELATRPPLTATNPRKLNGRFAIPGEKAADMAIQALNAYQAARQHRCQRERAVTAHSWLPPQLWRYPRCCAII